MNKKITLIILGQIRLKENQNATEKINYHIDKIKPHETILFFWDYDYEKNKQEIDALNLKTVILPSNIELTEDILELMIIAHNKQHDTKTPYNKNTAPINFYHDTLRHIYQTQETFKQTNTDSDIYIKTRYDNIYLQNLKFDDLINNFYNEDFPIYSTPFGGDYDNLGIGDIFSITNKKATNIFKNIYDTFIQELKNKNCPIVYELIMRYIFKNLNQSKVYRFHSLITTERRFENNLIYHANRNIFQQQGFNNIGEIIGEDKKLLPTHKP